LVSWWAGEGNAADSVGPNPGTLNNGVTFAPGEVGSAFSFNTTDYVSASTSGLPTGNSDRTLEMWVKANSFPSSGEAYFAGYGNFGSNNQTYHLGTTGSQLFWSQWGPGIGGPTLTANQWYHVAVTNIGNSVTLYLNGVAVGTNTVPIATPAGSSFYIGRIPGTLGDSRKLDGEVDEVSAYNRALAPSEILGIYKAGSDGKVLSPIAVDYPSVVDGSGGATTPVTFTITRTGSLSGSLTVNWTTADDTAIAGTDYTAASGAFTFADGQATQTVQVTTIDNNNFNPNLDFKLIATPSGGTPVMGLATIVNDQSITLTPATPPVTTASPPGTTVGTLMTSDANPGQSWTYSLAGTNANLFTIRGNQLLTGHSPLTAGSIPVDITATDSPLGLTYTQTVMVNVYTPITSITLQPATPALTTSSPSLTTVGTLTANDTNDGAGTLTFTITGPNASQFNIINGNTLQTATTFSTPGQINLTIQVTDALGLTSSHTVPVNVYNPITGITLQPATPALTTSSPAFTTVGTLKTSDPNNPQNLAYSLTGSNANLFTLSGNRLLTAGTFSSAGPVMVGIQVTDNLGVTYTQDVTVTVYQPITSITFQSATPPVTRASGPGTTVGTLAADDTNSGKGTPTFTVTSPNANFFTITSGGVLQSNGSLPAGNTTLTIQVVDVLGVTYSQHITFTVYQPITSLSLSNDLVTDDRPTRTAIGTLLTTDPNANSAPFTYALSGTSAGLFRVDNSTGTLETNTLFPGVTSPTNYDLTITSTDALGLSLAQGFTITVEPVVPGVTLAATTAFDPSTDTPAVSLLAAITAGHTITSWTISFGDGTSVTGANGGPGVAVTRGHAYPLLNAPYTITASVVTDQGLTFSALPVVVAAQISNTAASVIASTAYNLSGKAIDAGTLGLMTTELAILQKASVKHRRQIIQGILSSAYYRVELVRGMFLHFLNRQPTDLELGEGLSLLTLDKRGNFRLGNLLSFVLASGTNPLTGLPYSAADVKTLQKDYSTLTPAVVTLLTSADPVLFLLSTGLGGAGGGGSQSEVSALSSMLATSSFNATDF
jgi:hypothetical protein